MARLPAIVSLAAFRGFSLRAPAFFGGWRGLGRFWAGVLALVGLAGGMAQFLGPPLPQVAATLPPADARAPSAAAQPLPIAPPLVTQRQAAPMPNQPGRADPGSVADADPSLQEPAPDGGPYSLPKIAADGRLPMQLYAAGFDRSSRRPRIGVLIAGIGLSEADSLNAIKNLPGGVTLAVSPYGSNLSRVLAAARLAQHEYLVSIPMEPQGFPLNDPGSQALMTSIGRAENMRRLLWAMSRTNAYVGVTGALGDLRGERFAGLSDQMEPVLEEIARRGLLYIDPRPSQPPMPLAWGRGIDVVIDEPISRDAVDAHLADLEAIAREKGSALGLVGAPRPMTVERIAAWTNTLADKGFGLAPVSAMVQAP